MNEFLIHKAITEIENLHLLKCKTLDMKKCNAKHHKMIEELRSLDDSLDAANVKAMVLEKELKEAKQTIELKKDAEKNLERRIRNDAAGELEEARDHWVELSETRPGSLAEFIYTIFNIGINYLDPERLQNV